MIANILFRDMSIVKMCALNFQVLYTGWTPVLVAMTISSAGGLILDNAVAKFKGIAVFQPVFNGVGGNLVAVQASRISTYLHTQVSARMSRIKRNKVCHIELEHKYIFLS